MAGERRINFGADATDAKWRTEHDTANSKFILAEDLDGSTVLLEYDETASEWVARGPVNLDGNDLSNVGTVSASAVNTDNLSLSSVTGAGIISQAIQHGKVWADNGEMYESVQNAVDNASAYVFVGVGTFNESVSISTNGLSVVGCGNPATVINGGTTGPGIDITASDVDIRTLQAATASGGGSSNPAINVASGANRVHIEQVRVVDSDADGIFYDGSFGHITESSFSTGGTDGNPLVLGSNSSNNIADTNANTGGIVDNGTSNVIGDNS
jgi:hypothetical protein